MREREEKKADVEGQETLADVMDEGPVRPPVALVEGDVPALAAETARVLRRRLRVAAVILLLAAMFFLLRTAFWAPVGTGLFLFVYQAFVVLILVGCTAALFAPMELSLRELRAVELAVFGVPCLLFLLLHVGTLEQLERYDHEDQVRRAVQMCVTMWFALVLIYGTFIPNTLARASAVIGAMAAAPVVIVTSAGWMVPSLGEVVFWDEVAITFGAMAVAAATGLYGTYKISSLSRAEFAARQLGQYRLKELLGAGGMGEVYLAEHMMLKRPCAVKLIRPHRQGYERAVSRFDREVRAIAQLTHWNSVDVFDYGRTADGTLYYAMEYLPGLSLQQIVEKEGAAEPERVVHLMRQVCEALAEAHARGIVHRDIKPSNIMVSERGGVQDVAKLLDFGLATAGEEFGDIKLTHDGAIAGSPHYMAPERILKSTEPDPRCDIYSLGAVIYYAMTGRPPFQGDRPLKVMMAHARETPRPPSAVNADVPTDLDEIVMICLEKEPARRYPDVGALGRALASCESAGRWTQEMARARWG